jgi:dolichol-phosphate mannosyltransferase
MSVAYAESLVIIPTYNEKENVKQIIPNIFQMFPEISILIVDDGSPDGTGNIVRTLQTNFPNLHLIQRKGKLGLGTAYIEGFQWALEREFNYILEMDCDFSHDPKEIHNLIKSAEENDLVIGSRYIGGIRICNWSMKRLLLSYFASIYIRLITGLPLLDATGGFKCFRRRTLQSLDLKNIRSNGYSFQIELNYKVWCLGLKIKEIPITFYERAVGVSKMQGKIIWEALWVVFKLRFSKFLN